MRKFLTAGLGVISCLVTLGGAHSQDAPQFMRDTMPAQALDSAWQEFQRVYDPNAALDGKTKELVSIAVAAQIPCDYCIYFHTAAAKAQGATDEQIKEAIAASSMVRKWSTVLQGSQYDQAEFRREVDALMKGQ